jgi:hypothetical protein
MCQAVKTSDPRQFDEAALPSGEAIFWTITAQNSINIDPIGLCPVL